MLPLQLSAVTEVTWWLMIAGLNACLSKFSADDPLDWHFAELTMCFPQNSLANCRACGLSVGLYHDCQTALGYTFELWKAKGCVESHNIMRPL